MLSRLQQQPVKTKQKLSVLFALLVTVGVAAIWIISFDGKTMAEKAKNTISPLKDLGDSVQGQLDIYKNERATENLDGPETYQAPESSETPDAQFDESTGGAVQAVPVVESETEASSTTPDSVSQDTETGSQNTSNTVY